MKKFFTLLTACMLMLSAFAQSTKEYTEQLVITINEISTDPVSATVTVVDNGNGTINFSLNNFILVDGEDAIPVGNIAVDNLVVTEKGGIKSFSFNDKINIAEGNAEGFDLWMGPMLGEIPLTLDGQMNDEHLHVTIGIVMEELEQVINVELGDTKDFEKKGKGYTEQLVITINEISTDPVPATVTVVDNGDGTINFSLNNFILVDGEDAIPVGNIAVDNLVVTEKDGIKTFSFNDKIYIAEGDAEGFDLWMGPMLGEIPLTLDGQMNDEHLHVTIGIVMEELEQVINVELGDKSVFEPKTCEITFVVDDVTTTTTVKIGDAIVAPEVPSKEGYTFAGWEPALPEVAAEAATFTAEYKVNQYVVTFADENGEVISQATLDYGTSITIPTAPTKEGYEFTGWTPEVDATVPASDVTYTATWKEIEPIDVAITGISAENNVTYYTANGVRTDAPRKGVNIVKSVNGQAKKVYVK